MIGSVLTEKGKKMDDLISRQAAIEKTEMLYRDAKDDTSYMLIGYNHALSDMRAILKSLPSTQPDRPEQRWIPCSERLPKVGQDILMSVGGMYTAEGCLREDGDWAQFRWDTIQRKDMVGAWMPLPEPYKERRTDE